MEHFMNDKLGTLRSSVEFAEERLVASAQSLLEDILYDKGLSKTDLAGKMGVSKARVSQIFSDNQNFTLRLLASAFHALGEELFLGRESQRIEYKSADFPSSSGVSLEARTRELSHGFEWLDWSLEQGGQALDTAPISKACMARMLDDALRTAGAHEGGAAAKHSRSKESQAAALDWSQGQRGSNVIPMTRKKAVGNG
jgi:transcriptional regulator with XRE-family HTH domain